MDTSKIEAAQRSLKLAEELLDGARRAAGPEGTRLPGNDPDTARARIVKAEQRVANARRELQRLLS